VLRVNHFEKQLVEIILS